MSHKRFWVEENKIEASKLAPETAKRMAGIPNPEAAAASRYIESLRESVERSIRVPQLKDLEVIFRREGLGWALREVFLAGVTYAKEQAEKGENDE